MKKIMLTGVGIALLVGSGSASAIAQESVTLKFLTSWDNRFPGTRFVAQKYVEMVTKASNGRIKFKMSGPEVVKARQQFQPTSAGVFDLLFTTPVYHVGTTGVPMAFYALPPDSELWRKNGYWQFVDKEYQRFDQKLLAMVSAGTKDHFYLLTLKKPLSKGDKPLKGRKIRGNIFYKPLVEPLGGSLVNLDIGDVYSALEKGVVDGAAWPVLGTVDYKSYEVAKYIMKPRFGLSPLQINMNLKKFNSLSEANRKLLLDQARKLEQEVPAVFDKAMDTEIAKLKDHGVKETQLDPELFKKVNKGFLKGVWSLAINFNKKTKKRVEELYEMAKKNGDAPE